MPEGKIPADVERYVKEHKEKGYDEGYAWALAWSRYCEYKNPDSPHCHQNNYFEDKKGSDKRACGCGCSGCADEQGQEDLALKVTLAYLKGSSSNYPRQTNTRKRFR
jgi:hypothetical protein